MTQVRQDTGAILAFLFILFFSFALCTLSATTLYRQTQIDSDSRLHKFRILRYTNAVCALLQLIAMIGYLVNSTLIQQTVWIIWVPLSLYNLTFLGIKVAQSYLDLKCFKTVNKDEKMSPLLKICAFALWGVASLVDAFGSAMGWMAGFYGIQLCCYAVWKVFACGSLLMVCYAVFTVRQACQKLIRGNLDRYTHSSDQLEAQSGRELNAPLKRGVRRMTYLLVCLLSLVFFMGSNSVVEFISFSDGLHSGFDKSGYRDEHTLFILFVYFPLFSFVFLITAVYVWIPNKRVEQSQRREKSVTADMGRSPSINIPNSCCPSLIGRQRRTARLDVISPTSPSSGGPMALPPTNPGGKRLAVSIDLTKSTTADTKSITPKAVTPKASEKPIAP